jgi:acyl dehydratase
VAKPDAPLTLEEVHPGMVAELVRRFSRQDLETFQTLAADHAPLHHDPDFAAAHGYQGVVVFGFLAAAPFSGLLGDWLPGPLTVLHWVRFTMAAPVYPDEEIVYGVEVKQVSRVTGAVVLELKAVRAATNEIVLRGQAQCGFRL